MDTPAERASSETVETALDEALTVTPPPVRRERRERPRPDPAWAATSDTARMQPLPAPPAPAEPNAFLVPIYPVAAGLGTRHPVGPGGVVIGRDPGSAVYAADAAVSRAHARVEPAGGGYRVADLGSRNGTYVNDTRVGSATLRDGDNLRVGGCVYRFLTGGNVELDYHRTTARLALSDPLTGAPNRRALAEFLVRGLADAARAGRPFSLVLFDADHFKGVNDGLGHAAGDATLKALVAVAGRYTRAGELLARYGGEEFAVVLPGCRAEVAAARAEAIRRAVAAHPFEFDGRTFRLTVSVGVGTVEAGERVTPEELLGRADARLYAAKHAGRNRVSASACVAAGRA